MGPAAAAAWPNRRARTWRTRCLALLLGVAATPSTNTGLMCQISEDGHEEKCYVEQASGMRLCHRVSTHCETLYEHERRMQPTYKEVPSAWGQHSERQAACTGGRGGREEAQRRGRSGSASSASGSGSSASETRSGGGGPGAIDSGLGDDALSDMLSKRIVRRVADHFASTLSCLHSLVLRTAGTCYTSVCCLQAERAV